MHFMRFEAKRWTCAPAAMTLALSVLTLTIVAGCGPQDLPSEDEAPERTTQSVAGSNGLVLNGVVINGMVINGLGTQGLTSPDFIHWFNQDPALNDMVMKYVIYCSTNWGLQKAFTNPATGVTHLWDGWLGLAHHWSEGLPATLAEQQVVSACLAAHVNTYGLHIQLSLLGEKATNRPLYVTRGELAEYSTREACFFGNLFNGEGLYAGNDRNALSPRQSTPRRCGLSQTLSGTDPECSPITRVGSCEQLSCTQDRDSNYYRTCSYNGVEYKALTTRLHPSDVYTCGDGVCQVSERCGTGDTANSCGLDCGRCP